MFKIIVTGIVVGICTQQLEASPLRCPEDASERSYLRSLNMHSPFFSSKTQDIQKKVCFNSLI
ncbi:MAG: hypothetical protein IBJ00_00100 [Alphaproteobacteria bacterium]|nr:hypothetical protein [Alphaproteobacteria bacterium]